MDSIDQITPYANLKVVFKQHYRPLVSYAHNFIHSRIECEDLTQDIFVSIWEKKLTFSNETLLKAYLYKAVRNKCYNIIKHKQVKDNYTNTVLKTLQDDNLFFKQVVEEEIARELYEAIEVLPNRKKEVIKLSLLGIKNKDIALRLNIKLQTVKTLKSQAYKLLRKWFKDNNLIINYLHFFIRPNQLLVNNLQNQ